MVRFPPKAKIKKTVVDIWRYMTVADVANAMGKSIGKYYYVLVKDVQQILKGVVSRFLLCSINYPDIVKGKENIK
jgi:hypothetical protein